MANLNGTCERCGEGGQARLAQSDKDGAWVCVPCILKDDLPKVQRRHYETRLARIAQAAKNFSGGARAACLALLCALVFSACTRTETRSLASDNEQAARGFEGVKKEARDSHLCGARTKKGGTCTRRVKGQTGYCWQHQQ